VIPAIGLAIEDVVTTMTRSAKHQYLSNLASDFRQESVKFWKHFNYLSTPSRSQNLVNILDFTSEDINRHFLSVAQKTVSDGIPAQFVKASPVNMAMVITKLINKSIFQVSFRIVGNLLLSHQFPNHIFTVQLPSNLSVTSFF